MTQDAGNEGRDYRRGDRDHDSSPWKWVLGLVLLLALGWAVYEMFDQDEQPGSPQNTEMRARSQDPVEDDAAPAAGTIRPDDNLGQDQSQNNQTAQPATQPAD